MGEFVLRVVSTFGGWVVENGSWTSAVMSKDNALNLAEGMAAAVRRTGEMTRVVVEDAPGERGGRRPN
jgi:hypothetical protein